jgi:hypothetical protein
VGPAAKSDVVDSRFPASCDGNDVIEFEPVSSLTTMALVTDERASAPIPLQDRTPNMGWDSPSGGRCPRRSRSIRGRELSLRELSYPELNHSRQHRVQVAIRNPMAEQLLGASQEIARVLIDRHLERESLGCHRFDPACALTRHINRPRGR